MGCIGLAIGIQLINKGGSLLWLNRNGVQSNTAIPSTVLIQQGQEYQGDHDQAV